jgi:hypothetical protein
MTIEHKIALELIYYNPTKWVWRHQCLYENDVIVGINYKGNKLKFIWYHNPLLLELVNKIINDTI